MDIFKDIYHNGYQVRTKNEASFIQFDDELKEPIFLALVQLLKDNEQLAEVQLKASLLKKGFSEELVIDVIQIFKENKLFCNPYSGENVDANVFEIFNSKKPPEIIFKKITEQKILILGDSNLVKYLKQNCQIFPFKKVIQKSYNEFKSEKIKEELESYLLNEKIDFVVADANAWTPYHLHTLNDVALKHQIPWLYVGGVDNNQLKFGPLFYGKETGCYNCLMSRIKSNHEYPTYLSSYEKHLFDNKRVGQPDYLPNHAIYYNILGQLVALELFHFLEGWQVPQTWKTLVCWDINSYQTHKHKLLKLPYCTVCKPELKHSISPWLEGIVAEIIPQ
ncbi:MAG: TOMM precursor leader peptide-binding protein [Sphingobacteriaceae bacterium]|nr:TOMM precursor leader peptide-binding protein [Sphingobacteriaceae bacterium]